MGKSRRDIIRSIRRLRKTRAARAEPSSVSTLVNAPAPPVPSERPPVPSAPDSPPTPPASQEPAPTPEPVSIVVAPPRGLATAPAQGGPRPQDVLRTWMAGKSKTTLKTYLQDLRALAKWMGVEGPAEVVRQLLSLTGPQANALAMQWLGALKEEGLSSSTRARRLSTLKSVTEVSRIMGAFTWKIEVRGPRVQPLRDTSGPGVDASKLMLKACGSNKWGKRDRAILLLGLTLGLRREEICKLELKSYTASTGKLFVRGKGDKDKTFNVPDETAKALNDWLEVRGECNHQGFFIGAKTRGHLTVDGCYYIVRKLSRKAGVKHVAPHGLRHTAITTALDENNSVREVKDFSRHSKVDTVMIYDDNKKDFSGKIAQQLSDKFTEDEDLSLEDLLEAAGNVEEEETGEECKRCGFVACACLQDLHEEGEDDV